MINFNNPDPNGRHLSASERKLAAIAADNARFHAMQQEYILLMNYLVAIHGEGEGEDRCFTIDKIKMAKLIPMGIRVNPDPTNPQHILIKRLPPAPSIVQ